MSNCPFKPYTTQDAIFEKLTRYMPVADDTTGGTPRARSAGLKIAPPPRPRAPATQPPIKPINKTLTRVLPFILTSDGTMLTLYFSFRAYSLALMTTAIQVKRTQISTKMTVMTYSIAEHFSTPIIESIDELPLNKFIMIKMMSSRMLRPCLIHCPWPFSWFTNDFSFLSSRSCSALSPSLNSFPSMTITFPSLGLLVVSLFST
mmetsp:Transcript_12568/g.17342  ORF Transcript_12568/g.17342 Transcript_12568/m.17342 type:complete len:204 (+) Transcript_12568:313-924(+)